MGTWLVVDCAKCGRVGRARDSMNAECLKAMHEAQHTDFDGCEDENGFPDFAKVEVACEAAERLHPVTISVRMLGKDALKKSA